MVMCVHSIHANMYIIAYIQRPNAYMYKSYVNADLNVHHLHVCYFAEDGMNGNCDGSYVSLQCSLCIDVYCIFNSGAFFLVIDL